MSLILLASTLLSITCFRLDLQTNERKQTSGYPNLGNQIISPGRGYSTDRQQLSPIVCFNYKVSPYGKTESIVRLDQGYSYNEFQNTLKVDISTKVGIGIFSVEAGAEYMKYIRDTDYSMPVNYYQFVQSKVMTEIGFGPAGALTADGLRAYGPVDKPNPRFGLICGDIFISSFKVGAQLIFFMKLQFSSHTEKESFAVKFGASFDLSGSTIKGEKKRRDYDQALMLTKLTHYPFFCFSIVLLLVGITTLIIDFTQIAFYNDLERQINDTFYYSCQQVCGLQYYEERKGQCCLFYKEQCISKDSCISSIVSTLKQKQGNAVSAIKALSIISGILLLSTIILMFRICKKARSSNQAPLLVQQPRYNINQSDQGSQFNIDVKYDSFAYADQENTCSICLEYFKNEKAILLKCGHIYHRGCIRDWAAKQENCPVCRSSQ